MAHVNHSKAGGLPRLKEPRYMPWVQVLPLVQLRLFLAGCIATGAEQPWATAVGCSEEPLRRKPNELLVAIFFQLKQHIISSDNSAFCNAGLFVMAC